MFEKERSEIEKLRQEIEKCDADLLDLMKKRLFLVKKIWDIKEKCSFDFIDKKREEELYDKLIEQNKVSEYPFDEDSLIAFYESYLDFFKKELNNASLQKEGS